MPRSAGEVVEVGTAVTRFQVGDRVLGHAVGSDKQRNSAAEGAFQEYTVVLARMAAPIPGGCVRTGTMGTADRCRGRRETAWAGGQAAASSAVTAAQRSWKRHRRSASETCSPLRVTGRNYWWCSSNAAQQRAADTKLPKPRMGSYRCLTPR